VKVPVYESLCGKELACMCEPDRGHAMWAVGVRYCGIITEATASVCAMDRWDKLKACCAQGEGRR